MTPERRHTDDPRPPEGVPNRRACSDTECQAARSRWAEETLLPKLVKEIADNETKLWLKMRIETAVMIAGTVIFCAAIFQYLSTNAIRDYDLAARDKYITLLQHQTDMQRIEGKIVALETSVTSHLTDIRKSLDRNLEAITDRRR